MTVDEPGVPAASEPRDDAGSGFAPADRAHGPEAAALDQARDRDLADVARVRGGDLGAFNDLVDRYQDHLYGLAYRILADRDHAADAVQDAFLHAYRHLSGYRGGSFRSWLTRIAVNACMDVLRTKRRSPSQPYPELDDDTWEPPAPEHEEPEQRATLAARRRALRAALQGITNDQRIAILLYDVEGYDYDEIAGITGVSLGTVKSRIHRGRLALRELLAGQMELFH